ncbi:Putative anaphase-promoting complex subunit 15/mnd2 [Septoria linicola]|uniref:Anaphase-promoting complex subunit 15/mnd2 n=1 Tax=Septoria linicola TaxID=215465 RepID=A0A9Q9AW72_9PEZI|nr:putative anaphase-promoting complex subunit 15/mnd2 [Septoria linicola]USW53082.1 Putative anaphase-promoting complex subunit 15/mnd2 [Septoria linicola]
MLSLPLIHPQEDHSSFLRTTYRPRAESPRPQTGQNPQQTHRERQRRDDERKLHHARSPLALLAAEEKAIETRKTAVRMFGSQWIRPPGVPKTLQAMHEEMAERLEQEELERQERGMMDMQAQQQQAEAEAEAEEHAAAEEAGELEEEDERDLDDDIPDADASAADVTFNEDSMMEGSHVVLDEDYNEQYANMEEAELTGAAQDEEDLGIEMERDLDDSVPEAGSYQHTDSELEDSDSESELRESLIGRPAPSSARTRTPATAERSTVEPPFMGLQDRMRAQVTAADSLPRSPGSLNLSSSILDSSMMAGSSPVMQRSNHGGRPRAARGRRARYS